MQQEQQKLKRDVKIKRGMDISSSCSSIGNIEQTFTSDNFIFQQVFIAWHKTVFRGKKGERKGIQSLHQILNDFETLRRVPEERNIIAEKKKDGIYVFIKLDKKRKRND